MPEAGAEETGPGAVEGAEGDITVNPAKLEQANRQQHSRGAPAIKITPQRGAAEPTGDGATEHTFVVTELHVPGRIGSPQGHHNNKMRQSETGAGLTVN